MKITIPQLKQELLETEAILKTLKDENDIDQCLCLIEELESDLYWAIQWSFQSK